MIREDDQVFQAIAARRRELADEALILAHHYQSEDIVTLADAVGDSFDLSKRAAASRARFIIFCGVHFMAESAAILARPEQTVQIPDMEAGCWMADMVDAFRAEAVWKEIGQVLDRQELIPVTYMNSDAGLKAFCGGMGGCVCTSSNAPQAFSWALHRGRRLFFFPDEHLGRNTANRLGIEPGEIAVWKQNQQLGGNSPESLRRARVILWDGYCLVHTRFRPEHIEAVRAKDPEAFVLVHPECTEEVVGQADAVGSTGFMVRYVQDAPPGARIAVGTEANLIRRLAREHPDKRIFPLSQSICPNMAKITPEKLLQVLEQPGERNVVRIDEETRRDAARALENMLALPPGADVPIMEPPRV
jgi:quinolinate synthase